MKDQLAEQLLANVMRADVLGKQLVSRKLLFRESHF